LQLCQAVADTQAALSALTPTAIVIANHAQMQPKMGLTNGSDWNGKMYEHFIPYHNADYVPSGDQLTAFTKDDT